MKKRFTEAQIVASSGKPMRAAVTDLCRKHGFLEASYYLLGHEQDLAELVATGSVHHRMQVPFATLGEGLHLYRAAHATLEQRLAALSDMDWEAPGQFLFDGQVVFALPRRDLAWMPARRALGPWRAGGDGHRVGSSWIMVVPATRCGRTFGPQWTTHGLETTLRAAQGPANRMPLPTSKPVTASETIRLQ